MARKAYIKPNSGSPITASIGIKADKQWWHAGDQVRKNLPWAVKLLPTLERHSSVVNSFALDLTGIYMRLPGKEEQCQIATLRNTADQQLTLLRTQRTALDQQKRGLMQRLLTGTLRVKTR